MIFALLLFLSGITLSAVAIYYSVIGLTSIFAAAFWPVVVMGTTLEVSKLVAASWLKAYWESIPRFMKIYMSIAVVVLMLITSMGIFGFLSKAHLDQNLVGGDVVDQVAIYDEKIRTQKDNIEAARKALKQMDEAVDQTMARSSDEKGADKAAALRRAQQKERANLQNDISRAQAEITKLNELRAPIAKELRKVEAEVGPIKYIAKLIYGDNPDANLLEKAVTWVIMVIVFVFDPLAVLLLLGSQMTYNWHRRIAQPAEESKEEDAKPVAPVVWPFKIRNPDPDAAILEAEPTPPTGSLKLSDITSKIKKFSIKPTSEPVVEPVVEPVPQNTIEDENALDQWNKMIEEAERAAKDEQEREDLAVIDSADRLEKEAMKRWKIANPSDSLKRQRKMYDHGALSELPWMKEPYYIIDELSTEEVAQGYNEIAEQDDSDLKKKNLTYLEKIGPEQVQKPLK